MRRTIWFAGFPGSGTVKIQMMAATLLYGDVPSLARMDELIRPIFVDPVLPPDPLGRDVEPIFTHYPPDRSLRRHYASEGIVHVVRHPVDVAFSVAGYLAGYDPDYAVQTAEGREARLRERVDEFLDLGTSMPFADLGIGTWPLHTAMWSRFARDARVPYLRVRLEDARADETGTARRLAAFLGLTATEPAIAASVAASSYENSRRLEEAEIAAGRPARFYEPTRAAAYAAGWRYHGKGTSGYGKGALTQAQWTRAAAVFGRTAAALGYTFP
jgi:Sulfotransferase domain